MNMKTLYFVVTIVVIARLQNVASLRCDSPQYLEIGTSGVIECEFNEDFSTINWYYKLDITEGPPTISYTNEEKQGKGYKSGEFDIQEDGSLIINNVTIEHETTFTVYWYINDPNDLKRHNVDIKTIISPVPAKPIIDNCDGSKKLCYISWTRQTPLICRVRQARPAIPLYWSTSTADGDVTLTDEPIYINQTFSWTSAISAEHPFMYSPHLALLVCNADDRLELLVERQALALVHNRERVGTLQDVTDVAIQRGRKLVIPCTESDYQLLVWELIPHNDNTTKTLLYEVTSFDGILYNPHGYGVQSGSLVIPDLSIDHEGLYRCTYNDGINEAMNLVNVTVYVTPVPGYPIIEGCNQEQYCVLEVDTKGTLTCTVRGIRPEVKLEWRVFHEELKELLIFHGQQVHTRSNGDTMDVTLATEFTAKEMAEKRLTLECTAVGPSATYFDLSSKVDLLFSGSVQQKSTESSAMGTNSGKQSDGIGIIIIIVIVVVIAVTIVILIVSFFVCKAYQKRRPRYKSSKLHNKDEAVPMMTHNPGTTEMEKFVLELKFSYENLYSAIKPIPFLKDHCTVNELFVEGGIEYSLTNNITKNTWKDLESYRNLFTHSGLKSNRWIIEGEPGYGKSTLSLQLAYEWCAETKGSFMNQVEIFILIRLRQLKGVNSIYEAIKQFILPTSSHFNVDDIKNLIAKSSSVMIILDGYDEYPDSEEEGSDIFDIVERKMFPEARVVLTTRSSQLPKQFAAQTNRIRLTGFNSDCQERYLHKVVTVNGYKSAENNIKEWLEENPILKDLCEVPLFFVAYAHLSLESDALKNCTSVTTFFRYMITCLHSHMKSKFLADNVKNFEINENEHQKLDALCFESLNGHANNPVIEKALLKQKLGNDFVDQYLQIGILRDEEVTVITNNPGVPASDHVKVISNVRFYHSLFCEWYAAHHMANELVNNYHEVLEDVDTDRHHYVLRFACGISPKAAKDILEHLNITQEGLEILPLLCIVEQFGNVDYILENLREMCSGTLQLRDHDTRLAHRSVIQLVDLAASTKITVSTLVLLESFRLVDDNKKYIILNSEVRLPVLDNVEQLLLEHKTTQFTADQLDELFKYAAQCANLKEIRFLHSLLPYIIQTKSILAELKTKNIQVVWYPADSKYSLQLDSGHWQKSALSLRMTEQEYKKVVTEFENLMA